jgi:hypothetical protein
VPFLIEQRARHQDMIDTAAAAGAAAAHASDNTDNVRVPARRTQLEL